MTISLTINKPNPLSLNNILNQSYPLKFTLKNVTLKALDLRSHRAGIAAGATSETLTATNRQAFSNLINELQQLLEGDEFNGSFEIRLPNNFGTIALSDDAQGQTNNIATLSNAFSDLSNEVLTRIREMESNLRALEGDDGEVTAEQLEAFAVQMSEQWQRLDARINLTNARVNNIPQNGGGNIDLASREEFQELESFQQGLANDRELSAVISGAQLEARAELIRSTYQSGLLTARQYTYGGGDSWNRPHDVGYATAGIHSHWDISRENGALICGMAEWSAQVNGYYFRTRHNDYETFQPASGDFLAREVIEFPPVPQDVAALPPEQQSAKMRDYFKALTGQISPSSLSSYDTAFKWILAGAEVWFERYNDEIEDPYAGQRHVIDAGNVTDLLEKALYFAGSGHKNRRENIPFWNPVIRIKDENGRPSYAILKHRIICQEVGNATQYPLSIFTPLRDIKSELRFNRTKEEMLQTRYQRFAIDARADQPTLMDAIIGKMPGLNGKGAYLIEEYDQYSLNDQLKTWDNLLPLNSAYYNRFYSIDFKDASGRNIARRGFNDPTLWVAKNTRPEVLPFKDPQGNEHRFSYFLPVEMLLMTPLHNWNPYGVPDVTSSYSTSINPRFTDGIGRSASNPVPGYARKDLLFYHTPSEFYTGADLEGDPADTAAKEYWMQCADGTPRQHTPSGMPILLPEIAGVGFVRTRYPIYPLAVEGHAAYAESQALMKMLEDKGVL